MRQQRFLWAVIVGTAAVGLGCADDPASGTSESAPVVAAAVTPKSKPAPSKTLSPHTKFSVPVPNQDAVKQIASELKARDLPDALKLGAMAATPQAVWFTSGTPK